MPRNVGTENVQYRVRK